MKFALLQNKLMPYLPQETSVPIENNNDLLPISKVPELPSIPLNSTFSFNRELQKMTLGKQLLMEDLPFPLKEIQAHYENGYIQYRKGIIFEQNIPTCQRCGTSDSSWFGTYPCARCGEECVYCRKCITMGRISTCTPLISWIGPPVEQKQAQAFSHNDSSDSIAKGETSTQILTWDGSLSAGQETASNAVVESINRNEDMLLWAVCGAGKTEVLFKGIESALQSGKRICLATPRTDVVLELTPRLKQAFATTEVASLYGGSPDRHLYAPLTIATTHQLLRFYKAFDTIILDEVDAFPYSVEEMLQHAVQQARQPTSSLIYLTATPNTTWQKECRLGKRNFVTIPARYHRHPLPVPKFIWCGNWKKQLSRNKLPNNVFEWVKKRIAENKQALLFLPRIDIMEKILPIIRQLHPAIESVHAEDPDRKEKVLAMRNKEIPILLTTTILERGVTFPNLDVAVLGAEDGIFTESALVQIAGRVGRSADYPTGAIDFFHYGKTEEMVKAQQHIEKMNREARAKGMLKQ